MGSRWDVEDEHTAVGVEYLLNFGTEAQLIEDPTTYVLRVGKGLSAYYCPGPFVAYPEYQPTPTLISERNAVSEQF